MNAIRTSSPPKLGKPFSSLPQDAISGFLVFLIAMPLSLGIARASDWPLMAGLLAAIVGGLIPPLISNSELTIKGPAAGLIAIALGAMLEFKELAPSFGFSEAEAARGAYQLCLGVCVASAGIQIMLGLFRAGILVEFFPLAVVHGMLAAIGVIIFSKQSHFLLGVTPTATEPLHLLAELPHSFTHLNPLIALIGFLSLVVLFGLPWVGIAWVKRIPAPLVVLVIAIPLGAWFGLGYEHSYTVFGKSFSLKPDYLVRLSGSIRDSLTFPDFRGLGTVTGIKYVITFALIGSIESLLSAKAIDVLDPWQRKTDFNRDLLAVGLANLVVGFVGGLPMISEIVRSSANINNGARRRFSNTFHALFLLSFVAFLPQLIQMIPVAALAAMLVYTGYRLASPREFVNTYKIGGEQLAIFVITMIVTLATDLLVGVAGGIATKFLIHYVNGVPGSAYFKLRADVSRRDDGIGVIKVYDAAIFSNWIPFKRLIEGLGIDERRSVLIDLSETKLIDHSVRENLHILERDFESRGLHLGLSGLEGHHGLSPHPFAAMKRGLTAIRRITIYADVSLETMLLKSLADFGVSGYTSIAVSGAGRRQIESAPLHSEARVRIEVLVPYHLADQILEYLHRQILSNFHVTACVENVLVLRPEAFTPKLASDRHARLFETAAP